METSKTKPSYKKKPMSKYRIAFILFCCAVPVINWLIFYIGGNLSSFVMAFTNTKGELSFHNFIRFWEEIVNPVSDLRIALRNTLLTFVLTVIAFPLRVLVAYFIYKKIPGAGIYRVLFFLPSILFSVALSMIVVRMLGPNGLIAQGVQSLFNMEQAPVLLEDSRYANITVLTHMLWLGFPGDLIIWGGTFARIPVEVLEAGEIDGVNWWQEFTKIIVPIVWPTVGLQLVLLVCGIFSCSGAVFLLTGGKYGTMTLSCWMYLEMLYASGASEGSVAFNYLSAVGLIITILAVGTSLVVRKWADKAFEEVEF